MEFYRIDNKEFKIVPENNTVYGRSYEKDYIEEIFATFSLEECCLVPTYLYQMEPKTYTSKAVCDSSDRFDPKIGVDICGAKLDMKSHEKFSKRCRRAIKEMENTIEKLKAIADRHDAKAKAIRDDYEKYYVGGEYLK